MVQNSPDLRFGLFAHKAPSEHIQPFRRQGGSGRVWVLNIWHITCESWISNSSMLWKSPPLLRISFSQAPSLPGRRQTCTKIKKSNRTQENTKWFKKILLRTTVLRNTSKYPFNSTEEWGGKQELEQNYRLTKLSEQSQHHRMSKMPELWNHCNGTCMRTTALLLLLFKEWQKTLKRTITIRT